MAETSQLRLGDVESVFQLVNECREMWADADAWQRHLLRGACRLTHTAVGHYNEQLLAPNLKSTKVLDETFLGGWRDDAARARMFRMYDDHADRAAFFPRCTQLAARALKGLDATAVRRDIRPDREWYDGWFFNEYRRPAYVDDFILCFALNRRTGSLIMLTTNQDVSDRAPTPHAAAILSLLTRQIAPLVGTQLATQRQKGLHRLSPRLNQTLQRLLAGDSEKEIAARLALGHTTVHDYVGTLYRHFGATSRAELMAYFLRRCPEPSVETLGPPVTDSIPVAAI